MPLTKINFAEFANHFAEPIVLIEPDGRLLAVSEKARSLLNIDADVEGIQLSQLLGDLSGGTIRYLQRCARSFDALPGRFELTRRDGERIDATVMGARISQNVDFGSKTIVMLRFQPAKKSEHHRRFIALNNMVNQLEQQVAARKRTELLLAAEKKILSRIVSGMSLKPALKLLAEAIEESTSEMKVSILLLDEDDRLRHAAAPSLPPAYIEAIDGLPIGPGVGSCGTAAYTGETVIVTDVQSDPKWKDFRELGRRYGFRACWSAPIRSSHDSVLGTLALYFDSVRRPTANEVDLIENTAHIAALAIERHFAEQAIASLLEAETSARERAEAESKAKDEFLAILSHEIRNPLGAISNAAYALDALGGADKAHHDLNHILIKESVILKRILDDLLDLSRLNNGKMGLTSELIDMSALMADAVSAFRTNYPGRRLLASVDEELGWIEGDPTRIWQMLLNLVDNAMKYSGPGDDVEIAVSADQHEYVIIVRDRGIGIDAGILPTIFDPFVQSDKSLARTSSGLGLGLALVRQFAELHGGSVTARSEGPGLGSEFELRLPRAAAPDDKPEPVRATGNGTKRHILVVEDNESAREGLCTLLKTKGHAVQAASDGEQALEMMRAQPPDIALVDIGLPTMDGYQVARTVRQELPNENIRLIALTGYGQNSDKRLAAEAGFSTHLIKPVDLGELMRVLDES